MANLEEKVKSNDLKKLALTGAGLLVYGLGHAFNFLVVDDLFRWGGVGVAGWNGLPLAYRYAKSMWTDYKAYRKAPKQ